MVYYSDNYDFLVDFYNTSHYFCLRNYIFYSLLGNIVVVVFVVFPFLNLNISRVIWRKKFKGQSFIFQFYKIKSICMVLLGLLALNEFDGLSHENTIYEKYGLFSFLVVPHISLLNYVVLY